MATIREMKTAAKEGQVARANKIVADLANNKQFSQAFFHSLQDKTSLESGDREFSVAIFKRLHEITIPYSGKKAAMALGIFRECVSVNCEILRAAGIAESEIVGRLIKLAKVHGEKKTGSMDQSKIAFSLAEEIVGKAKQDPIFQVDNYLAIAKAQFELGLKARYSHTINLAFSDFAVLGKDAYWLRVKEGIDRIEKSQ